MGKAERNRRQGAREKIAAQQAAARRAEMRQRGLIAGGSVLAVIAIVVAFVVIKAAGNSSAQSSNSAASQPASVMRGITNVPAATLAAVGAGTTYSHAIQTISGSPPLLTQGGRPHIVYVGAEYCPYCAAERWAMVNALSRFGTFSGLGFIHSSASDVDPSTPTLTFHKSSYASKYLVFSPTEARNDDNTANLEPLTKLDTDLMKSYDAPPYVTAGNSGSFPFVDIANKYVIDGASYDPAVLKGLTWAQVAAALKDPSSPVAKAADGTANLITAAICKVTGGKPGSVCTAAGVIKASGAL